MASVRPEYRQLPKINSAQRGALFDTSEPTQTSYWERCVVIDVHIGSKTCAVLTDSGSVHNNLAFPQRYIDPQSGAGEYSIPKVGTVYALHYHLGYPVLMEYTSEFKRPEGDNPNSRVTGVTGFGAEDGMHSAGFNEFNVGPPDLMAGDWTRVGSAGNLLGVLEGGITVFKASELAQIIAIKGTDLLKLLGRNLEVITGFGKISFVDNEGKTSMSVKGGANYAEQTSPNLNDNFTIHADLGSTGNLVDFKITDPRGNIVAGIHYGPDGEVTRVSNGNNDTRIGGSNTERIGGNNEVTVGRDYIVTADNNILQSASNSASYEAIQDHSIQAGQDVNIRAQRNVNITAGKTINVDATGDLLALPGDTTVKASIINGSLVLDIGNPIAGDLQKALSGVTINVNGLGSINLNTDVGGINLKTKIPDSVLLGGQLSVFHAVLFEMLEQFLLQLGIYLDSHIHATGVGPSSPPIVPPFQMVASLLPALRSQFVTIGG